MALTAFVNGERKDATRFSSEQWSALKVSKPVIELCCCKTKGFMRVSNRGTRHFVHARKPDTCTSGPESELHLYFKSVIAEAIRAVGWDAEVEMSGPEGAWRADVMATRRTVQVAFEVQLSPITLIELQRRQSAYAAHNVRGCWFYGSGALNALPPVGSSEPLFPIFSDERVCIGSHPMKMREAVISLLKGHFRHCAKQRKTTFHNILIYRFSRCWACGRDFDIFSIMERGTTCWDELPVEDDGQGYPLPLNKSGAPWIVERVQQFVNTNPQLLLELSIPGWFYAQSSRRKHYTFCCYHCGQLTAEGVFEQLLLHGDCTQDLSYSVQQIASIKLKSSVAFDEKTHWCFSTSRRFCC
ncbi:MAG: competence protein CoiA [Terracidiphilus sp.]